MKRLMLGSLFDGIGGFPLAAQRCGIKTAWACDIDPTCVSISKRHFPDVLHLGDITKVHGGKIPPVDIISFGSPCQDLSTGGQQKGLKGERSGLFFEAVRIVYEMRYATNGIHPAFVIWENVPGAFNSNGGRDFQTVLLEITKADIPMPSSGKWAAAGMAGGCAGCASIAWRQIDSQFWGVPQRRKRIFLVGDFGGQRAAQILFECESVLGYVEKSGAARKGVAAVAGKGIEAASGLDVSETVVDFGRAGDRVRINASKSATLIATDGGGAAATGLYLIPDEGVIYPINDGAVHGNAKGLGFGEAGDIAPTLTASDRHGIAVCYSPGGFGGWNEGVGTLRASAGKHGHASSNLLVKVERAATLVKYALRKLTPLECERLQGFPDYWTKYTAAGAEIADTPRYAAIGNSLTVPCAERVFRGIVAVLNGGALGVGG